MREDVDLRAQVVWEREGMGVALRENFCIYFQIPLITPPSSASGFQHFYFLPPPPHTPIPRFSFSLSLLLQPLKIKIRAKHGKLRKKNPNPKTTQAILLNEVTAVFSTTHKQRCQGL